MPKLLYSGPSPYSAKARMAAALAGYAVEAVSVDTNAEPDLLIDNNPLGKIPVLLTDDGRAVFDSAMILQFINREKRNSIFRLTFLVFHLPVYMYNYIYNYIYHYIYIYFYFYLKPLDPSEAVSPELNPWLLSASFSVSEQSVATACSC